MKKYRIKKVEFGEGTWYEVQYKGLIFWHSIMDVSVDQVGGYSEWPRRFNTQDEAENFIVHYSKEITTIVKEFTL